MTEKDLQQYIRANYPKEDEGCEWKEFKTMKNAFSGDAGNDVVSYVSALANMEGGHLVMGVEDKTLEIIGIDNYNYDAEKVRLRLKDQCANLPTEGLRLQEFRTDDTQKLVWVLTVPKHNLRLPVYAHSKAWQRLDDSLVEMTQSRLNAILDETPQVDDWSAKIIPEATIDDLDPKAIRLAREKYIELYPHREDEVRGWDDITFLNKAHIYLSHSIVKASQHIGLQTSYIKNKSFNDNYYKDLILQYITQFRSASRVALTELINDKLSDTLNERQKFDKLTNLLSSLKKAGKIRTNAKREWVLVNDKD